MNKRGFTLLEVLVATAVMAVAVAGLMSALTTTLRSADRLTAYDRAVLLGRQKMDELLVAEKLPKGVPFQGTWDPAMTGGQQMGWRARLTPFEKQANAGAGTPFLERIELEIWWMNGERRRTFGLEGFRRAILTPEDFVGAAP